MVKIKEWTDEEVERLRELYTSNKTFDEIVDKFPMRTENAIRLKASRLGIKRPFIGDVVQVKPLAFKSWNGGRESGYLMKCKECGSWIQVDEESHRDNSLLSCGKCGSLYQVITDL
jgi:translation initiation factor 2 beta subunit (eIF-2beta)/eIF-5